MNAETWEQLGGLIAWATWVWEQVQWLDSFFLPLGDKRFVLYLGLFLLLVLFSQAGRWGCLGVFLACLTVIFSVILRGALV